MRNAQRRISSLPPSPSARTAPPPIDIANPALRALEQLSTGRACGMPFPFKGRIDSRISTARRHEIEHVSAAGAHNQLLRTLTSSNSCAQLPRQLA
jgi:hypothetical protein